MASVYLHSFAVVIWQIVHLKKRHNFLRWCPVGIYTCSIIGGTTPQMFTPDDRSGCSSKTWATKEILCEPSLFFDHLHTLCLLCFTWQRWHQHHWCQLPTRWRYCYGERSAKARGHSKKRNKLSNCMSFVVQACTLPKTNISPENRPSQVVSQTSIFRCYFSFRHVSTRVSHILM